MSVEHFLPLHDDRTLDLLRGAVVAAHIKAALDRSPDQEELALLVEQFNRVYVDRLPDRPTNADGRPLVRMWHTQEELCDLTGVLEQKIGQLDVSFEQRPRRVRLELLRRRFADVMQSGKAALTKDQMNR